MYCNLLSMLVVASVACVINPVSAEEISNDLKQQAQLAGTSAPATEPSEQLDRLITQEPTAAGQPQDAPHQNLSRKWHSPDGTRTWEGLNKPD